MSGVTARMDRTARRCGLLCAITTGQARFARHRVPEDIQPAGGPPGLGAISAPRGVETSTTRTSSRNQTSLLGLPPSLGSRSLAQLAQTGTSDITSIVIMKSLFCHPLCAPRRLYLHTPKHPPPPRLLLELHQFDLKIFLPQRLENEPSSI